MTPPNPSDRAEACDVEAPELPHLPLRLHPGIAEREARIAQLEADLTATRAALAEAVAALEAARDGWDESLAERYRLREQLDRIARYVQNSLDSEPMSEAWVDDLKAIAALAKARAAGGGLVAAKEVPGIQPDEGAGDGDCG